MVISFIKRRGDFFLLFAIGWFLVYGLYAVSQRNHLGAVASSAMFSGLIWHRKDVGNILPIIVQVIGIVLLVLNVIYLS